MSNDRPVFPKIGDRVQIDESGAIYVVVDVDEETETVSVLPETEVVQTPLEKITTVDPPDSN